MYLQDFKHGHIISWLDNCMSEPLYRLLMEKWVHTVNCYDNGFELILFGDAFKMCNMFI